MNFKKYLFVFLIIFLITFVSAGIFQKYKTCGDGTYEGQCSDNAPYFCSQGILVEKASVCGCPNNMVIEEDFCTSFYKTSPMEINLTYVLRGKENKIPFTVYGGMADYLFDLPDTIHYDANEIPQRQDFKLRNIDEENQKTFLMPLVIKIQNLAKTKEDQARIAINLVQQIPFGGSNELITLGANSINYSRYPYEVLYEGEGICASKSELMVFLLREIGYETVFLYHKLENHDAVGIKCPSRYGFGNTSYCFVETTGPAIITDVENTYLEGLKLTSYPNIMNASEGYSFGYYMYEYQDAKKYIKIRGRVENTGKINLFRHVQLQRLREKYGLE